MAQLGKLSLTTVKAMKRNKGDKVTLQAHLWMSNQEKDHKQLIKILMKRSDQKLRFLGLSCKLKKVINLVIITQLSTSKLLPALGNK